MQRSLIIKTIIVFILAILLVIPLKLTQETVQERQSYRDGVINQMAQTEVGQQSIIGPYLQVPYQKIALVEQKDAKTGVINTVKQTENGHLVFLPDTLTMQGDITQDNNHKLGIYKARFYDAKTQLGGAFKIPAHYGTQNTEREQFSFGTPVLMLGIKDVRGIGERPSIQLQGKNLLVEAGTFSHQTTQESYQATAEAATASADYQEAVATEAVAVASTNNPKPSILSYGVHAITPITGSAAEQLVPFKIDFTLRGMEDLSFTPLGQTVSLTLNNQDGAIPNFSLGQSLPKYQADNKGFSAKWQTTALSSNIDATFSDCYASSRCSELEQKTMGVRLVEPVDTYLQADRALKYGFLFIVITFVAFFLFEVLKRLAIHPVQYALVGVALALFYLLLISLSEHIAFGIAYAIASGACIALLAFYLSYVLRSIGRSIGFSVLLAILYGALYVLLQSSDYALLLGSGLMFLLLAIVMLITRKIDWYAIGKNQTVVDES